MKRLFILLLTISSFANAQEKQLIIQGTSPNLFINHTVAPKENYYSIGRLYNISPKEIAPFNNLQMDKGLNLGQAVKIPLTTTNFTQTNTVAPDEVLVPVYYVVNAKEGLYRVSAASNKLPIETIKKWNKLTTNELNTGTHLIIGYLKVKKELSDLANMGTHVKPEANTIPKQEETVKTTNNIENKNVPQPAKTIEKQSDIVKEQARQDEPKATPVKEPAQTDATPSYTKNTNFGGGTFKALYQQQNEVKENGHAGVFKSTSGWEDGRYYCLHNNAQPQTIIKITSNTTGKTIYAKVMDVMPDIRQNKGLEILISNAAANELGVGENKFDCTISYSK